VLVLHHENRDQKFYGSIYIRNSTRNMWRMEASPVLGSGLGLRFYHEKANSDRRKSSFSLRMKWSEDDRMVNWYEIDYDPVAKAENAAEDLRRYVAGVGEATGTDASRAIRVAKSTVSALFHTTEYEESRRTGSRVFYRLRKGSESVRSGVRSCPETECSESVQGVLDLATDGGTTPF